MDVDLTFFAICSLWGVFAASLAWSLIQTARATVAVVHPDGRQQERRLPFLLRMLLPFSPPLVAFFQEKRFDALRARTFSRLTASGFDDLIVAEEFLALRILSPLIAGPLLIFLLIVFFALSKVSFDQQGTRLIALAVATFLWTAVYPQLWLKQAIALRHKVVMRALPYVIDLLTLSVEAGLDFMAAIKNIIDRRKPDPLGEELSRVLFEIQLGKTRREALRHMADRINHVDIQTLISALVQADEMGVSIGLILRIQSDQIRTKRFMTAEKLANEAPVKMLFPLIACIFPAVFLILLGPIILQMLRGTM